MSDVSGPCFLWLFWCDCPRQAERLCRVSRFLLDKPGLIYQGRWTHGDSAGTSNLLRWGTSDYGGCCSLGARTWSGHRVLSLGMCDSLILLGRGTLDCGGCWSLIVWIWSGHRIFPLGWCDSLILLCKGYSLLAVFARRFSWCMNVYWSGVGLVSRRDFLCRWVTSRSMASHGFSTPG